MKTLILGFLIFFVTSAMASSNIGTEVKPVVQDGKPRIGVQYGSDFLALTLTLMANDVAVGAGARVYAEFWNKVSNQSFSNLIWQNSIASGTPAGTTYVVRAGVNGAAAQGPVAKLKSMILVLTATLDNGSERKIFVDLASLCATNPESFVNLDSLEKGCP